MRVKECAIPALAIYSLLVVTAFVVLIAPPIVKPMRPTITVEDIGRLGNQMFEYASLYATARMYNWLPYISQRKQEILSEVFPGVSITGEHDPGPTNRTVIHKNYLLLGNFSKDSKHYLIFHVPRLVWLIERFREDIRREFTFHHKIQESANRYLHNISTSFPTVRVFIGVHVRRTDFLTFLSRTVRGVAFNSSSFYAKAMRTAVRYLRVKLKEVVFVVASDDIEWCRENLSSLGRWAKVAFTADFHSSMEGIRPEHFDLCALASCNHSVFDYGTYGFWASYLTGGHVFLPELAVNATKHSFLVREILRAGTNASRFHFIK